MEFEPEKEEIVWCRAACGNNIHKTCFQQWAFTQRAQGVRCVLWYDPVSPRMEINTDVMILAARLGSRTAAT